MHENPAETCETSCRKFLLLSAPPCRKAQLVISKAWVKANLKQLKLHQLWNIRNTPKQTPWFHSRVRRGPGGPNVSNIQFEDCIAERHVTCVSDKISLTLTWNIWNIYNTIPYDSTVRWEGIQKGTSNLQVILANRGVTCVPFETSVTKPHDSGVSWEGLQGGHMFSDTKLGRLYWL